MAQPDFYLSSSEGYNLSLPRKCFYIKGLKSKYRDDWILVGIEPLLDVSKFYGPSFSSLDKVLLASRHKENSLFPANSFPVYVFVVAVLVENPENLEFAKEDQLQLIAWGEVYKTYEDALWRGRSQI